MVLQCLRSPPAYPRQLFATRAASRLPYVSVLQSALCQWLSETA